MNEEKEPTLKLRLVTALENEVTIVLTTTDLYEKLPTNRDYLLKDGHPHETSR